jgi:hypothetical protein
VPYRPRTVSRPSLRVSYWTHPAYLSFTLGEVELATPRIDVLVHATGGRPPGRPTVRRSRSTTPALTATTTT